MASFPSTCASFLLCKKQATMVTFQEVPEVEDRIQEIVEDDKDDQFTDEEEEETVEKSQPEGGGEGRLVAMEDEADDEEDEFEKDDVLKESVLERIAALVDIVPPTTRVSIGNSISNSTRAAFRLGMMSVHSSWLLTGCFVGKSLGSGLWMLATASLLVILPVSLELERDSITIQEAQQMRSSSTAAAPSA